MPFHSNTKGAGAARVSMGGSGEGGGGRAPPRVLIFDWQVLDPCQIVFIGKVMENRYQRDAPRRTAVKHNEIKEKSRQRLALLRTASQVIGTDIIASQSVP